MVPRTISGTAELAALCDDFAQSPYVTIDTEFLRERTYWPVLCLVQLARPRRDGESDGAFAQDSAAIVDPLAKGLDLAPLYALLQNSDVVKVFHAARQDIEIFDHQTGEVPVPVFDTQIAAMVCGFGDQVGYERLVKAIAGCGLDKSSRFTDWSQRPLSKKQLDYAIGDVTHLRDIYEALSAQLQTAGRTHWLTEEMQVLADPATYRVDPDSAWKRLKLRSRSPKIVGAAKALAAWREREAQSRDVPRNRIVKDDALVEIAASRPSDPETLYSGRMARRANISRDDVAAMLRVLADSPALSAADVPADPLRPNAAQVALAELLRTLLKAKAAAADVAERMIASSGDLERLAMEEAPEIPALGGWRREIYGEDALRLKRGEIALSAGPAGVEVVERSV